MYGRSTLSPPSCDEKGVASLVAQPTAGALKSLEMDLDRNQITDEGCAGARLRSPQRGAAGAQGP